jgi:hypothetical protein
VVSQEAKTLIAVERTLALEEFKYALLENWRKNLFG